MSTEELQIGAGTPKELTDEGQELASFGHRLEPQGTINLDEAAPVIHPAPEAEPAKHLPDFIVHSMIQSAGKKKHEPKEVDHYDLLSIRPFLKTLNARLTRKRYAETPIREYLKSIEPVELAQQYLAFYDAHPFYQEVCAGAKHHHWWKGGLEDHVREMIGIGMDLMDLYTGDMTFSKSDVIIVCFLHDFDKIWGYRYITADERDKDLKGAKRFKEKQVFTYVEGVNNILDGYALKILELGKFGIVPTKEQWSAVLFHEGGYADANFDYNGRTKTGNTVMHCNHLAPFVHMLDIYSAMILGRSIV